MDESRLYAIDRNCIYQGVKYKVVDVLTNNLVLVVNYSDFESGNFPLQTFIIPDEAK